MQWDKFVSVIHNKLRSKNSEKKIYKERKESEIISLVSKNSDIEELISSWLQDQFNKKSSVSSERARSLRNDGNNFFKSKNYSKSLALYTESAKYSSGDGDEFSIAIANRSACLFHMCRYQECTWDVKVAIESGYPEKLVPKIKMRAVQCYIKLRGPEIADREIMEVRDEINSHRSLSAAAKANLHGEISQFASELKKNLPEPKSSRKVSPEVMTPDKLLEINEKYPSASPSLTRGYSPTRGRFVIAEKPIKRGEVLFVEKPFAFVPLDHETRDLMCGNCCGDLPDVSYPCRRCVEVCYCSLKCWRESWARYHKWECPGYEMGIWRQIGIAHLAIKVLLVSATTEDVSKFNEVQKLVTNIKKLPDDDLMVYSISALMLTKYLYEYTDFSSDNDVKVSIVNKFTTPEKGISFEISTLHEEKKFIACLLLRHMLQLIANGHAITRLNLMNIKKGCVADEQQQRVAVGIYPSVSMMNHSCDPTIMNTFWNDYLIVKSTKDVEIGEEIFNCYGPHFRRMSVEERQESLKKQYCFQCKCLPCTDTNLQSFLDRFTAFKCSSCSGPLRSLGKVSECLDCHETFQDVTLRSKDLEKAQELFTSSQDLLEVGKFGESKNKLLQCLEICRDILFKHHEDIAMTLDSLGKVSVMMDEWLEAISYLEESLITIEEKFGSESIEVANELNKITDVCAQYLNKEMNRGGGGRRRSEIYKDTLRKTEEFLNHAEEIMNLISGPWDSAWRELREKREEMEEMFERLHV